MMLVRKLQITTTTKVMNNPAQNCDHADFQKILSENCEKITSSLYDNNTAITGPKVGQYCNKVTIMSR